MSALGWLRWGHWILHPARSVKTIFLVARAHSDAARRRADTLTEQYRAAVADDPAYPFESADERAASRSRRQTRMSLEAERLASDPEDLAEVRRIQDERREW